ncbi:molybdate ABC transporter permease subunit [Ochrovirga pacifica]|uniref:molybdate ABC transporter permease subunit n=1 Tax=Ochrovirga pacifica TaxID=1042376 RepID=UPI000255878A|nr:molybdate ABC transporter permease subunit [Ochrovirga pacifica]
MEIAPILLTLKLACITTVILFVIAIPISYGLVRMNSKIKPFLETIVSLPLVLPPTVLGFYFLISMHPNTVFGQLIERVFGQSLVFSFSGLVVASILYSLPFMVHPIQSGLASLPKSYSETAELMGKSKWTTLWRILLPNIKPALLTGIVLSFAHTIGEFGVVLMIGGNIPNQTQVASIAIYDEVESLNYAAANEYSLVLLILSFAILLSVYLVNGGNFKRLFK